MAGSLVLASGSATRQRLLRNAGLSFETVIPRVDEAALRAAMADAAAGPRDVADALAEAKARKVGGRRPDALTIGCDQILAVDGTILAKPDTPGAARAQLRLLRGRSHTLLSAAVICAAGQPVWRHVGAVRLTMRAFSDRYLEDYVARNWPGIGETVGAYKLEQEGVRLFSCIEGDHFNVLGLPLLELLAYLVARGDIDG